MTLEECKKELEKLEIKNLYSAIKADVLCRCISELEEDTIIENPEVIGDVISEIEERCEDIIIETLVDNINIIKREDNKERNSVREYER